MSSSSYPHTQLLLSTISPSVVISGCHIQTIDSSTGDLIYSSTRFSSEEQAKLQKAGPIRCSAIDASRKYLATISEDKMLKVWDLADGSMKLASERELPKKPTTVAFTADTQTVLVSDKFGDVFSYTLHPSSDPVEKSPMEPPQQPRDRSSLVSHPSTSGTLILGHTSLLTTFVLSHDERYIITADRDEHIRVSWYPQGYCIESYCLGSTKFVSALHIPKSQPSLLISGGGDNDLKIWDWKIGELKYEVQIWDAVKDQIVVKVPPYKKKRGGDDDEGDEEEESPQAAKRRKKGDKTKDSIGSTNLTAGIGIDRDVQTPTPQKEDVIEEETVLAVQQIDSLIHHDKIYVLFSITGGTSLYMMECPTPQHPKPTIYAHDTQKPVLNFCILPGTTPSIWLSVDSSWSCGVESADVDVVQVVEISNGNLRRASGDHHRSLLSTLNTTCLISGDAKSLGLYAAIKSMPKNRSVEHNAMDRPDDVGSEGGETARSRKEIGKMKSKKAILERQQSKVEGEAGNVEKTT